jgi:serine/threonine protein kinase
MIGKGGFANVYKAVEIHTKAEVAVKVVSLEGLSIKDL